MRGLCNHVGLSWDRGVISVGLDGNVVLVCSVTDPTVWNAEGVACDKEPVAGCWSVSGAALLCVVLLTTDRQVVGMYGGDCFLPPSWFIERARGSMTDITSGLKFTLHLLHSLHHLMVSLESAEIMCLGDSHAGTVLGYYC